MVFVSFFYVTGVLFLGSTLANHETTSPVDVFIEKIPNTSSELSKNISKVNDTGNPDVILTTYATEATPVILITNISRVNSSEVTNGDEKPRDKRALGVILQGLVEALGYTTSPISYSSLPNPNTTAAGVAPPPPPLFMFAGLATTPAPPPPPPPPPAPSVTPAPPRPLPAKQLQAPLPLPLAPQAPVAPPAKPAQPAAAAPAAPLPARRRETLRFTGVVNFGNNSDLLGHLQQYERLFHATSTAAPAAAPAAAQPPKPSSPPQPPTGPPRASSGKPALLPPFLVQIPLPIAPNLPPPLPPSAPRKVKEMEYTYTKQENKESYERQSEEISDESAVRKEPPPKLVNQDTYIDEPEWKKKQRQQQQDGKTRYKEDNYREEISSVEQREIEEKNKQREKDVANRERENAANSKENSAYSTEKEHEAEDDGERENTSEGHKKNNYKEEEEREPSLEKSGEKRPEDSSEKYQEKEHSSEEYPKKPEEGRGESEKYEEKEVSGEEYTKKPEQIRDDSADRENSSKGYESDNEHTAREFKRTESPREPLLKNRNGNSDDLRRLRGEYRSYENPYAFAPNNIPSAPLVPTDFGSKLPVRVFEEPIYRGGLRNSYGQSLERDGRIDDSVADYFQKYKNPETGLYDSRKIIILDGGKKQDTWWNSNSGNIAAFDPDPISKIREEYGPPATVKYEEYTIEDERTQGQRPIHDEEPDGEDYADEDDRPSIQPKINVQAPRRQEYKPNVRTKYNENDEDEDEEEEDDEEKDEEETATQLKVYKGKSIRQEHRPKGSGYDKENPSEGEVPELLKTNVKRPIRQKYTNPTGNRYEKNNQQVETGQQQIRTDVPGRQEYDRPTSAKYENYEKTGLVKGRNEVPLQQVYDHPTRSYNRPTSAQYEKYNADKGEVPELLRNQPASVRYEKYNRGEQNVPGHFKADAYVPVRQVYQPTTARPARQEYNYPSNDNDDYPQNIEMVRGHVITRMVGPYRKKYDYSTITRHLLSSREDEQADERQKGRRDNSKENNESKTISPTTSPTPIKLRTVTRRSNEEKENEDPKQSLESQKDPKKFRVIINEDSDEDSKKSKRLDELALKNPLPFKDFDFIKYSPYFRPIQVSFEPDKLQRTAKKILTDNRFAEFQKYEKPLRNSDEKRDNRSSKTTKEKNESSRKPSLLENLREKNLNDREVFKYSPYFRPIQLVYEPEKLQRTADKILLYQSELKKQRSEEEQDKRIQDEEEEEQEEKTEVAKEEKPSSENLKKSSEESREVRPNSGESSTERKKVPTEVGLPERLTGKALHEGETKDVQAWPAPFDHTFDSTERADVIHAANTESVSTYSQKDIEPTYETTGYKEYESLELTSLPSYLQDTDVSPTYETPYIEELQSPNPEKYYPLDSDVSPTFESPTGDEIRSQYPTEYSTNDRPPENPEVKQKPRHYNVPPNRQKQQPQTQQNQPYQETTPSREEDTTIPLQNFQPHTPRAQSEGQLYRPQEEQNPDVQQDYREDNKRNEENSSGAPPVTTSFEDPRTVHEFFGLSQNDYSLDDEDSSTKSGEQVAETTTIPSTNTEKELLGLLTVREEDPNYQRDVPLTEFTDGPETDTETVNVKEYRNKVASVKVSQEKQLSSNEPIHHIGFLRSY